ncbi:MAG TPA: hypothetical protein VF316_08905 [Polyangiaceae bacterium]
MSSRWRDVPSRAAVVVAIAAAPMLAIACSLDEGSAPSDGGADGTLPDGGGDARGDVLVFPDVDIPDVVVPPTCQTLDASCLPSFPPDAGWQPVATGGSAGCSPDAGFAALPFVSNPTLKGGACACGCKLNGNLNCGGSFSFTYWNDPACSDGGPVSNNYGDNCAQHTLNAGSVRVAGGNPAGVSCDGGVAGDAGFDTTAVRVCAPTTCTSDYCGLAGAGLRLCIIKDGDEPTCPSGFAPTPQSLGTTASSACLPCGCGVTGATCGGTMSTYGANCNSGQLLDTIPADGGCYPVQAAQRLAFALQPGTPQCTAPDGGGAAVLVGRKTLCCVP